MNAAIICNGTVADYGFYREYFKGIDFIIAADGGAAHARRMGLHPHLLIGDFDSIAPEDMEYCKNAGAEIRTFPVKKDKTDTEIAIDIIIEKAEKIKKTEKIEGIAEIQKQNEYAEMQNTAKQNTDEEKQSTDKETQNADAEMQNIDVEKQMADIDGPVDDNSVLIIGALGSRYDHSLANIFLLRRLLNKGIRAKIVNESNEIMLINSRIEFIKGAFDKITLLPLSQEVTGVTTYNMLYPLNNATIKMGSTWGVSNEFAAEKAGVAIKSGEMLVILARD